MQSLVHHWIVTDKHVTGVLGSNRLTVILLNDTCNIPASYSCIIFESNQIIVI